MASSIVLPLNSKRDYTTYRFYLNDTDSMEDIVKFLHKKYKNLFEQAWEDEVNKRPMHDIYSPARVTCGRMTFVLHKKAFPLLNIDMSNNYLRGNSAPWLSELTDALHPFDRIRYTYVGIKMIVSSNFLHVLQNAGVLNGLWPSYDRSGCHPLLSDAFLMFFSGFYAYDNHEPLVALAVASTSTSNNTVDDDEEEDDEDKDDDNHMNALDAAKTHQPFVMKTVMRLSQALNMMKSTANKNYLLRGSLKIPELKPAPKFYPDTCDLFFPGMEVCVRKDDPEHTVVRDERMTPVYRMLYDEDVVFLNTNTWPLQERVNWVNRSLKVSVRVAKEELLVNPSSTRVATQQWFRFSRDKNMFKCVTQILLRLVDPDSVPIRDVPLVAVLEKWTPRDPAQKPHYALLTVLTPTQAYCNARAFEEDTEFDC